MRPRGRGTRAQVQGRSAALIASRRSLRREIGVPHTLKELGVPDTSKADQIAKMAIVDPTAGTNPVPLDEKSAKAIFLAAFEGKL